MSSGCPHCGYKEKRTLKSFSKNIGLFFLKLFLVIVITPIIVLPLVWYMPASWEGVINDMQFTNKTNFIADIMYNIDVARYQNDVRNLSVELVRGCGGGEDCYFWNIYGYLSDFDYIKVQSPFRPESPLDALQTNSLDCKTGSVLICSMFRSVGIDCFPSSTSDHVVAVVTINGVLIRVDLTGPSWRVINNTKEIWR